MKASQQAPGTFMNYLWEFCILMKDEKLSFDWELTEDFN